MMPMLLSSHSFDDSYGSLFSRNMILSFKQLIGNSLVQFYKSFDLYLKGIGAPEPEINPEQSFIPIYWLR